MNTQQSVETKSSSKPDQGKERRIVFRVWAVLTALWLVAMNIFALSDRAQAIVAAREAGLGH